MHHQRIAIEFKPLVTINPKLGDSNLLLATRSSLFLFLRLILIIVIIIVGGLVESGQHSVFPQNETRLPFASFLGDQASSLVLPPLLPHLQLQL
jgi:hypothetical protein